MAIRIFILLSVLLGLAAFKQDVPVKLKHTTHRAFRAGEVLDYSLSYGFFSAGTAKLEVTDTVLNGNKLLHLEVSGRTVGLADIIYKVRDVYESFIDPETDMPVKAIRNIREGGYRYYNEVLFDRDSSVVISQRSGVKHVPENTLDILSAFYYGRDHYFNDEMKNGDVISFETYFSDKLFPFQLRYLGTEKVRTKFGKVECYKFAPVTEVGRAFKTKEGMFLWLSKDGNCIPVKIKFELVVGAFVCDLENYKGLRYPFTSLKQKHKK